METSESRRGAKYMEGYLEVKESSKWMIYWVVVRGSQLFFFNDSNTQITDNIKGHVDIGPGSTFSEGKKSKHKFEFEIKAEQGKKYLLRAGSEILRFQWIHSLALAAQGKSPPPQFVPNQDERAINQYCEVPNLTIRPDVCEVTDREIHKMFRKKFNSFGSHCKELLGNKNKKEESRQPVSEGSEAKPEPFYDIVPDEKPPWYFGKLTREQSEAILENYGPGRYLVRESESVHKAGAYTLSLRHRDRCRHHKIETLPDGNLVIKQHEDKPFPNLATLMKYFIKSQEKEISLLPVICEEKGGEGESQNGPSIPQERYDKMEQRPPAIGCEDRQFTEGSSDSTSPRHSCGYENLPSKQRGHPSSLKKRLTEPVLHSYQNVPAPKAEPPVVGSRSPPLPDQRESYEAMSPKDFDTPSSFEEPKPSLPPRRPANRTGHGYENLPDKGPPPKEPTGEGYVNPPPKPGRSPSDPPQLPPRNPRQNKLGYENIPSWSPPQTSSYQNIPPEAASRYAQGTSMSPARRDVPPMKRASTLPPHILQNTLGHMSLNEGPY